MPGLVMATEIEKISRPPPQPSNLYDSEDELMDEEIYRTYSDQVDKSDGFEVDALTGWGIGPMYIHGENKQHDYEWYAQIAVAEYNRRFKDKNSELEFVKVLKSMGEPCAGLNYYITFTAKDLGDGCKLKTYQTKVYENLRDEVLVTSFRLKPTEVDEQGNLRKEWFWKRCHCGGTDKEIDFLPPIPPPSDLPYDDGDCDKMEEKLRTFWDQVSKSDGFDVDSIPGGKIRPMDINVTNNHVDYECYSKLAVNEYNRRFKEENRELQFVKVLKAMAEPAWEFRFYITFMAKDIADGCKVKTYQAVLSMGLSFEMSVLSFRLEPTKEEQNDSGNYGKEWYWKGHHCERKHTNFLGRLEVDMK